MKARWFWGTLVTLASSCASGSAHAENAAGTAGTAKLDVSALAASNERLYVGSFDSGLYVLERSGALEPVADAALNPHVNALAWSARERVLWVGTARGLTRCPAGKSCTRIGPEGGVHAVSVTSNGSVIAGGDAGLVFVDGERVRTFGKKEGAPFRSVWALAEAGERLFVGTTSGLFWGPPAAFSGKHAELGRAAVVLDTLPDDWVTALGYRDGALFVGTYSAGVAEFRSTTTPLVPSELDPALGYVNPAGIAALGNDCIAVATMDGLEVGAPGRTHSLPTRARDVTAVVPDPNGGFWIGTRVGVEFWNGDCVEANAAMARAP